MIGLFGKIVALLPASDRIRLAGILFLMALAMLLEVMGVGVIPVFLLAVSAPEKLQAIPVVSDLAGAFGVSSPRESLAYGMFLLVAVFAVKNAYLVFYHYVSSRFIYSRFAHIGSGLFHRYMHASYVRHLGRNSSGLIRNVTQEANILAKDVMDAGMKLIMDVALIIGIVGLLLWMEPLITFLAIVFLGGATWAFLRVARRKSLRYGREARQDRKAMIQIVQEGLGGFKDIRMAGREAGFVNLFGKVIRRYGRSLVYRHMISASAKPVIETLAIVGMLLIALALHLQGRGVGSIVPILTLFGVATIRLMPALNQAVSSYNAMRFGSHSVEAIHADSLSFGQPEAPARASVPDIAFAESITFDRVTFGYPGAAGPAVRDLTLEIRKNQVIGIVGASGAGKTTLVDLLLGLLEPSRGSIRVDGVDVFSNLRSWRRNIGYVPQAIFLMDASLRHNIALGVPPGEIDEEQLNGAIRAAQLEDLVRELPEGVDTVVGERGIRLSGGQRQRIGIARALYRNPGVLILDEATASLDNMTEKYVVQAMERLKRGITIVMIAHRLTTVRDCDVLFFMKDGEIAHRGTYQELLENNLDFQKIASV